MQNYAKLLEITHFGAHGGNLVPRSKFMQNCAPGWVGKWATGPWTPRLQQVVHDDRKQLAHAHVNITCHTCSI